MSLAADAKCIGSVDWTQNHLHSQSRNNSIWGVIAEPIKCVKSLKFMRFRQTLEIDSVISKVQWFVNKVMCKLYELRGWINEFAGGQVEE